MDPAWGRLKLLLPICVAAIGVAACAGEPTRAFVPREDPGLDCGTQDNPCLVNGVYVIGSPSAWTPCTSLPGGCFPKNDPTTPIVWGSTYAGGGWSPLNAKGTGLSPSEGTGMALQPNQLADIQMAIKMATKCYQINQQLLKRYKDSSFWGAVFSDPNEYGFYASSSESIFISLDKHWYYDPSTGQYSGVIDWHELEDTLVHEAGHDWFGPPLTPDSIPTNINIVTSTCD